jgi:hypothetical protein
LAMSSNMPDRKRSATTNMFLYLYDYLENFLAVRLNCYPKPYQI